MIKTIIPNIYNYEIAVSQSNIPSFELSLILDNANLSPYSKAKSLDALDESLYIDSKYRNEYTDNRLVDIYYFSNKEWYTFKSSKDTLKNQLNDTYNKLNDYNILINNQNRSIGIAIEEFIKFMNDRLVDQGSTFDIKNISNISKVFSNPFLMWTDKVCKIYNEVSISPIQMKDNTKVGTLVFVKKDPYEKDLYYIAFNNEWYRYSNFKFSKIESLKDIKVYDRSEIFDIKINENNIIFESGAGFKSFDKKTNTVKETRYDSDRNSGWNQNLTKVSFDVDKNANYIITSTTHGNADTYHSQLHRLDYNTMTMVKDIMKVDRGHITDVYVDKFKGKYIFIDYYTYMYNGNWDESKYLKVIDPITLKEIASFNVYAVKNYYAKSSSPFFDGQNYYFGLYDHYYEDNAHYNKTKNFAKACKFSPDTNTFSVVTDEFFISFFKDWFFGGKNYSDSIPITDTIYLSGNKIWDLKNKKNKIISQNRVNYGFLDKNEDLLLFVGEGKPLLITNVGKSYIL